MVQDAGLVSCYYVEYFERGFTGLTV